MASRSKLDRSTQSAGSPSLEPRLDGVSAASYPEMEDRRSIAEQPDAIRFTALTEGQSLVLVHRIPVRVPIG